MLPETAAPILAVLAGHPAGITAKAAAVELGWKETAASFRLGRLTAAGEVLRTPIAGRNQFIYRLKPVEAPPTAPTWAPAVALIAERMIHA